MIGSERLTGATLDRLTHRCRIIETKGESYRLHDAKARTRRSTAKKSVDLWTTARPHANFTPNVLPSSIGARFWFRSAFTHSS